MGLWDKIKKTLLKGLWPSSGKRGKAASRKPSKRRKPVKMSVSFKRVVSAKPKKSSKRPLRRIKKAAESVKRPPKRPKEKAPAKKNRKMNKVPARQEKAPVGEFIGTVTHYFPQVNVAALKVEKRGLMAGETLYFQGHTTKFKTVIKSMQINRKPVLSASVGDEIGVLVPRRVRAGDQVFFRAQ